MHKPDVIYYFGNTCCLIWAYYTKGIVLHHGVVWMFSKEGKEVIVFSHVGKKVETVLCPCKDIVRLSFTRLQTKC